MALISTNLTDPDVGRLTSYVFHCPNDTVILLIISGFSLTLSSETLSFQSSQQFLAKQATLLHVYTYSIILIKNHHTIRRLLFIKFDCIRGFYRAKAKEVGF